MLASELTNRSVAVIVTTGGTKDRLDVMVLPDRKSFSVDNNAASCPCLADAGSCPGNKKPKVIIGAAE